MVDQTYSGYSFYKPQDELMMTEYSSIGSYNHDETTFMACASRASLGTDELKGLQILRPKVANTI